MNKQERTSYFQQKKEKRINNLINCKEYDNKNKQRNLPRLLTENKKDNLNKIEGKQNNIKLNIMNGPITSNLLYKNKDDGKILNTNVELIRKFDKKIKKNVLSERNPVNNKKIDEIKKEDKEKKKKLIKFNNELNNKEEEKYYIKDYLKKELNIIKEAFKKNNKNLKNLKEKSDIISLKLNLSGFYEQNKKLKKMQEQKNLLQKKNIEKEKDEIKKKINRSIRLKSSILEKKPLYEELKRNRSMDIGKSRYLKDILKIENRKNKINLLETENNLINNFINNKIENPYSLNYKKIEEVHPNIFALKNKNKIFDKENENNYIFQENKNGKNIFFQTMTTRNSIENKGNFKIFKLKGKGLLFSKYNYKNNKNIKDLNCSEKGKRIKNYLSEDIKDDEKERKKENDLNLIISLENDKINQKLNKSEENDKNANLQKENKNIKEELKLSMDEIERLKKENNDLLLKNEELYKEKLKINNNKLENIKKEKIELNKTINNLIEKNEELQKEKEEINNELLKEKEKNKEINNLKLESKDLKEKIKEEKQKYNNLNNKNIELNKENENIKLELKKGIEEKNNLIKEKEKLYEENSKNKIEIIKYNKENNDLILKNDKIEKQLNELKISYEQQNEILMKVMNNNPMILYLEPPLKGLNNIGATCFMNSTLQCLSQTKELTNYFLKQKNKNEIINNNIALENKNNYQLSPVFLELIQKLWDKNGDKSFYPTKFMNTVNNINPLFKTGQAGDAKDFIIFVLEQLHKELRKSVNFNNNSISEPLNQYDKNNAFNYFFKDFKSQVSIISDIFYGFNETTNECLNCKNIYNLKELNNPICYNYGLFNCLIFPLEEIKNFKNNNNCTLNNYYQINNSFVSIYDCFQYNQKTELFSGDNRNYCNICKQLYDSYYTSKIYICPTILILILNRGKGNIFNVKLFFDEIIDITDFVLQKEKSKIIYNLYGVITHIGESGPNAHFIASCKSPIDKKWYRYNDSIVNPIENIQKEIIDFGTPYILFYHKQES